MSQPESHPSFLELDRHALERGCLPTAAHVAQCTRCQAYLAEPASIEPAPAWIGELLRARRARRRRTAGYGFGGLALAAALCLVVLRSDQHSARYIGVKGAPSVAVHVNRGGNVALWDHAPLLPGDRIRLEVAPQEFGYASVFSAEGHPPRLSLMFSGRVPVHGQTLLPKAWLLDAAPGPERVLVMFSHAEISEQAATALLDAHDPRDVAIVSLTLPKSLR